MSQHGVALLVSASTGLPIDLSLRSDVDRMAIAERTRSRIRLVVTAVILALLAIFPWVFLALWKMQTDPLFGDHSSGAWINLVASLAVQGIVHLCFFVGCALLACTNRYLTTFTILILHWGLHAVFVCAIYGSAVLGLGQYRSGQFVKVQDRMLDHATADAREEYKIASEPIVRFSHFPLITVVYLVTSLASVLVNTVPALRLPPVESTYSHLGSVLLWSVTAVLHCIHYADIWSEAPHPVWISLWTGYALVATVGVRMNAAHDTIRWTQLHLAQLRDQRSGRSNGLRIVLVEPTDSCNSFISCLIGVKPTCCPWRAPTELQSNAYQPGTAAPGGRQGRGKPSILPVFVNPTIMIPYSDRPPPTASGSHHEGGPGGSSGQRTSISSASSAGARMLASGTAPTIPHGQQAVQYHKKVASVPSGAAAAAADRYAAPRANMTTAGIRKNRMASSSVSDSDHIAMDVSDTDPEEGLLGTKQVNGVEPQREETYPSTARKLTTGLRRNEGGIVNSLWGQSRSRDSSEVAMVPYLGQGVAWQADSQRPHRMWMDKEEGMFRLALSSGGQGGHLFGLPLVGLLRPRPNAISPASMSTYKITRETVVFQDPRDISRSHPVFGYLEAALVHCESYARRRTVGTSQEHPGPDYGNSSIYQEYLWQKTLSDEDSILTRPSGSGSEAMGPVHLARTANLPEHHPPFVWVPAVDESTNSYVCFRSVGLGLIASIGRIFGTSEALDEQGDGPWLVDRQIAVLRQFKVSLGGRYGRNSAAEKDLMAGLGGRSPRGLGSNTNASDAHRVAMGPQLSRDSSFGVRTSRNRSAVTDSEFEAELSSADEQEQKRSKPAVPRSTDTLVKRLRCSHLARYSQALFSSLSPLQVRVGLMITRQVQLDTAALMRNLSHPAFGSVVGSDGGPRSSRIPSVIELGWSQQLSRMNHHAAQDSAVEASMNEVDDYGRQSPGAAFYIGSAGRLQILHYIASGLAHLHSFEPPVIHGSISTDAILQQDNVSIRISNLHVAALRLRMQGALQRLGLYLAHGSAGHKDPVRGIRSFDPSEPWKVYGLQIDHIECSENSAWFLPKGESGLNERIAYTLFGEQLGRLRAEGKSPRPYGKPWASAKASNASSRKDAKRTKGGSKSTHMMLVQSGAAVAGDTAGSRAGSRARVPMPRTPSRSLLSGVGARSGTTTAAIANEAMKVQDYDNSTDGDGSHSSLFSLLWSTEVGKEEGHHLPVHVFDVPIPVGISSSNEVVEKVLMKQSVHMAASSSPALCCGDVGSTQVRDARIFASCYLAAVSLATTRRCCLAPEVCNFAYHCRALRAGAPAAGAAHLESIYPTASQDIYGFGTIMVEMAFGCSMETVRKYAGGGTTVIAYAVRAYWKQFKRATVSAAYVRLAMECLATIPEARPKAADLIGMLHDMSVDLDSDATPSTPAAGTSGRTDMFRSSRLHHQHSRSRQHTEGFEMSRADNSTMGASDANVAMPEVAIANAASVSPPKMRRSKTSDVPKSKEGLQAPYYVTEASNIRKSVTAASGSKGSHRAGSPRHRQQDSERSSKKSSILPTAQQADAPSGRASLRRRYSGSALLTKSYKRMPNSARRLPGPPNSVISSYKSQSRPHDLDRVRQQVLDNLQAMQSAVDPRQFNLLNGIGEGTYAIVYRGTMGHLPVAIKSFKPPPQGTANSASMMMLLRRIKIALTEHEIVWRLSHPNIVRSFGWAVEGNDVSLLWQLCEVGTLKNVLVKHFEWERGQAPALTSGASGAASEAKSPSMVPLDLSSKSRSDMVSLDPLPKVETLGGMHRSMGKGSSIPWLTLRTRIKLLHDIAIAIEHIHRANIVHRDIKPNNIFLTRQDSGSVRAVLGDFGEATYVAPNARVSGLKGTIGFCAPEVFRGRQYDRSVDIYSFGATITAMMSCHAPFMYDERVVQAYFAILRKKEKQKSQVRLKPDSTRARGHMYRDKVGMYLVQSVSWSEVNEIDLSQVQYDWSSIIKMVISPTPLQYWIEWNVRRGRLKPQYKCFTPLKHPDTGDLSSIKGVHVWPGLLYGSGHNTEPVSGAIGGPATSSQDGRLAVITALGRLAGICLSSVPSRRPSAVSVAAELRRLLRQFIPSRSYLRQMHYKGKSMLAEAASTSSQGSEYRGIHAASDPSGAAGSESQTASGGALVKWSREAKGGSTNEGKYVRVPGMLSSQHSGGSLVPRVLRSHGSEEVSAAVSKMVAAGGLDESETLDSIGVSRVRMLMEGSLRHATSCPSELVAFSMLVSRMILASLGPNTATGHDAIRMAGKDLVEAAKPNADVAVQQFTITKRMRARWVPMGVTASTVTNVSSGSPGKLFDISTAGLAEESWQRTLRNLPGAIDTSSYPGIVDAYSRKKRRKQLEALSTDAAAGMAGTVLPRDFRGLHPSVAAFVSLEGAIPSVVGRSFKPLKASMQGWNPASLGAEARLQCVSWGMVLDFFIRFCYVMPFEKEDYWMATCLLLQLIHTRMYRYLSPTRWHRTTMTALLIAQRIMKPGRDVYLDMLWPTLLGLSLPLEEVDGSQDAYAQLELPQLRKRVYPLVNGTSIPTVVYEKATGALLPYSSGNGRPGSGSIDGRVLQTRRTLPNQSVSRSTGSSSPRPSSSSGAGSGPASGAGRGDASRGETPSIPDDNTIFALFAPATIENTAYGLMTRYFANMLSWKINADLYYLRYLPGILQVTLDEDGQSIPEELLKGLKLASFEQMDPVMRSSFDTNLAAHRDVFLRHRASEKKKQREKNGNASIGASHAGSMLFNSIGYSIVESDEGESDEEVGPEITRSSVGSDGFNISGAEKDEESLYREKSGSITGRGLLHDSASDSDGVFRSASGSRGATSPAASPTAGRDHGAGRVAERIPNTGRWTQSGSYYGGGELQFRGRSQQRPRQRNASDSDSRGAREVWESTGAGEAARLPTSADRNSSEIVSSQLSRHQSASSDRTPPVSAQVSPRSQWSDSQGSEDSPARIIVMGTARAGKSTKGAYVANEVARQPRSSMEPVWPADAMEYGGRDSPTRRKMMMAPTGRRMDITKTGRTGSLEPEEESFQDRDDESEADSASVDDERQRTDSGLTGMKDITG